MIIPKEYLKISKEKFLGKARRFDGGLPVLIIKIKYIYFSNL
jgi:hypothetical protein